MKTKQNHLQDYITDQKNYSILTGITEQISEIENKLSGWGYESVSITITHKEKGEEPEEILNMLAKIQIAIDRAITDLIESAHRSATKFITTKN